MIAADALFFEATPGRRVKSRTRRRPKARRERSLHCISCQQQITSRAQAISVDGGREHTFTNPHGITFHLGCFKEAPGCVVLGEPTNEFTWFAGHAWQMAHCVQCNTHLGWYFCNSGSFFGLILKYLVELPD